MEGIEKTIVFVIFIFIGMLLKRKFNSPKEVNGIKKIILNLALPATIFLAILKIDIDASFVILPIAALGFNLFLFWIFPYLLPLFGLQSNTAAHKTAWLLMPSLAPGLSCFPFVLEFLGDHYLAQAAMADLGNKVFVLIILYWMAMHWYYQNHLDIKKSSKGKLASLLKTLLTEPVNLFIIAALVLIVIGIQFKELPQMVGDIFNKLSLMMTPLVLLFIGLAVKIKRRQFFQILSLLSIRASIPFLTIGLFVLLFPNQQIAQILLYLCFGLSACSFWPFSHIALVDSLETKQENKTFDSHFAVAILALSFPVSTAIILGVLNSHTTFDNSFNLVITGLALLIIGFLKPIFFYFSQRIKISSVATSKGQLID